MIVEATNCHRGYAASSVSLAADFASAVVDFKDMPMGIVQCLWTGAAGAALDGTFRLYASALPDLDSFDPDGTEIEGAAIVIHNANGARAWLRDRLAFRYLLIRYFKGSMTAGVVDIVALGKKS
jgi:hypothetical protein